MSRVAAKLALLFALLLVVAPAFAQDGLGGGADFDDGWDAILKLTPPSTVAATETPRKKGTQSDGDETLSARERRHKEREARESVAESKERAPRETRAEASESERDQRKQPSEAEVKGGTEAGYAGLVRSWHEPWPAHAGDQAIDMIVGEAPVLSIHPVGKSTTPFVLLPNGKDGGFSEAQIEVASLAFGAWPKGPRVSPRLLDLIYHAAMHFNVFHVHLVSGIRNDRSGSRHSHGLAADIVLPGVSDDELAAYFRPQGFLGVGIYTRAGFVHVDVRERSYFWLDKSPPNKRTRIVQVRADEARQADEAAMARGQLGYVNPLRLQKALHARAKRRMEKARASQ